MVVEADYMKTPVKGNNGGSGNGGGGGGNGGRVIWGWRERNQALLGTFSLMILSLILIMTWETTGPGALNLVFPPVPEKLEDFQFGDGRKANAAWASSAHSHESERMLDLADQNSIYKIPSNVKKQVDSYAAEDKRYDTWTTQMDITKVRTSNATRTKHPSHQNGTQEDSSRVFLPTGSKKSQSGRNALITKEEPEGTTQLDALNPKKEVCDLTNGKWVKDNSRPFYSGKECKAYLSSGFACQLMTRPNFDYEKLRWQPEGCDMAPFTADGFLKRMRNKVVAFVGDSLGRQQFQSLMCMLTGGKNDPNVEDVSKSHKWGRDTKWVYRFRATNTTVLFHWTVSLCEIGPGLPSEEPGYSAMHMDRPVSFLKNFLHRVDVIVLNTGHHWNRGKLQSNKWRQYVDGKPLADRQLVGMGYAMNFTVHKVVEWLDRKLANAKHKPAVFFRTLSPRHFKNGDWNTGGSCDGSHHLLNPAVQSKPMPAYKGPITDRVAEIAVSHGTRVHLLNVTHLSQFREEGHISKYGIGKDSTHQDCLHWCLPGVPDVWNELLYAELVNNPDLSPVSTDQG